MAAALTFDPSPSTAWGDRAAPFGTECQGASSGRFNFQVQSIIIQIDSI